MDVSRDSYRSDGLMAYTVFFIMLGVYVATLAPTITLEYSGQLIVAGHHLGVGRTPGYPIWHLLAKGFTMLFPFAEYGGQPNPAWAVHFLSAFFGAAACSILVLIVLRVYRGWAVHVAALSSALIFGLSPAMWSQSVIAETHTLTVFYILLFLLLLMRWMDNPSRGRECLLAFMMGFGLTISYSVVLLVPVILLAAWYVSRAAFLRMLAPMLVFAGLICALLLLRAHPAAVGYVLGATTGIVLLACIPRHTRAGAGNILLMLCGLTPFVYLPLAGSHSAPMNMGNPGTWDGFWHVITRGQYERMTLLNPFAEWAQYAEQWITYIRMCGVQFTWPILSVAFIALVAWPFLARPARRMLGLLVLAWIMFSAVALIGLNPSLDTQSQFIIRVYFIPSFAILAALIGVGCAVVLDALDRIPSGKRAEG